MKVRALTVVGLLLLLTACSNTAVEVSTEPTAIENPTNAPTSAIINETSTPTDPNETLREEQQWTYDELYAMALTLAGECYDDKEQDKRLVCEVILNRVSDGHFGDSILAVITKKNQFEGYWKQSRPITDNDFKVAEQTLKDWFENDCKALSNYLFFTEGKNRENVFRSEY